MAKDSKGKYTHKQKRKAEHIEDSYEKKGLSEEKASEIAWATVNKQSGGGERSGSGKKKPESEKKSARKDSAHNAVTTKREKSQSNSLESQTKADLMKKAQKKNIAGRSSMNKPDLIAALRGQRGDS